MSNVNWNSFRVAVYSIAGGVVAALGAWGIISESQVDSVTQVVTSIIGALIAILAAANVNKGSKVVQDAPVAWDGDLPVYDAPSSAPAAYEGKHRLDG